MHSNNNPESNHTRNMIIIKKINVNRLIIAFFLLIIISSANSTKVRAQCNPEVYSLNCIEKIKEGFVYMKSYNVDGHNGSKDIVEYTAVFSKDAIYFLNICTESNDVDGIILTIYDSKRDPVTSNKIDKELLQELEFKCKVTGIYYLTFTFREPRRSCGGCVLTLKK